MSVNAIVKAIEAEYRTKTKAASDAYNARMKPARGWVDKAREKLKQIELACARHAEEARGEENAALVEAKLWRDEALRAVRGERPFKISDVSKIVRVDSDGRKVSLPRLACLDAGGSRNER